MDFNYETLIYASPEEVFTALTNPFQIELWSGSSAIMKAEEGFEFSLWDGDIAGVNLKINENQFIQQEWFFGEQTEKSIVSISLKKREDKTLVSLKHTNIPDEAYEEITEGWKEYYIGALKDLLEAF